MTHRVQFSSVQDGISVLRKAHMRSTLSLSFPNIAFETVPAFVWLTMALSLVLSRKIIQGFLFQCIYTQRLYEHRKRACTDSRLGEKIPSNASESVLHQKCAGPDLMLNQLCYIPFSVPMNAANLGRVFCYGWIFFAWFKGVRCKCREILVWAGLCVCVCVVCHSVCVCVSQCVNCIKASVCDSQSSKLNRIKTHRLKKNTHFS